MKPVPISRDDFTQTDMKVEELLLIHKVQLLSYLKLSGCKLGLSINFSVKFFKD